MGMDRLQGSLVQAAIKRLVKEFKSKVRPLVSMFLLLFVLTLFLRLVLCFGDYINTASRSFCRCAREQPPPLPPP